MNIKTSITITLPEEGFWLELSKNGELYLCSESRTMVNKKWKPSVRRVRKDSLFDCLKVVLTQHEYKASSLKEIIDTLKDNVYAYKKLSAN